MSGLCVCGHLEREHYPGGRCFGSARTFFGRLFGSLFVPCGECDCERYIRNE